MMMIVFISLSNVCLVFIHFIATETAQVGVFVPSS